MHTYRPVLTCAAPSAAAVCARAKNETRQQKTGLLYVSLFLGLFSCMWASFIGLFAYYRPLLTCAIPSTACTRAKNETRQQKTGPFYVSLFN